MIQREISAKILQYAKQYPVVTITGPRQSGKTTLCKMLFPQKAYVSLENIDDRQFAENDPKGFLARFPNGAVIDEVQRVPDLLSYIQSIVDETQTEGFFILTGSQQPADVRVVAAIGKPDPGCMDDDVSVQGDNRVPAAGSDYTGLGAPGNLTGILACLGFVVYVQTYQLKIRMIDHGP